MNDRGSGPTSQVFEGDALALMGAMPSNTFDMAMTSPPYFNQRDYGVAGQLGLEATVEAYLSAMVSVFREVRRVLRPDGSLWCNVGDSFASSATSAHLHNPAIPGTKSMDQRHRLPPPPGYKPKDLLGVPWRLALALQADGWWLRCDVVWEKPNAQPEACRDRPTRSHEYLFLLTKSRHYYYDRDAVREPHADQRASKGGDGRSGKNALRGQSAQRPRGNMSGNRFFNPLGRNTRSVWSIATKPYKGAHCATYPPELCRRPILATSRAGGVVLDPFCGAGTTGVAAMGLGRHFVGLELNPASAAEARARLATTESAVLKAVG